MKRSLIRRMTIGSAVAAMALGAVACEDMEANGDLEQPGIEDGGGDMGDDTGGDF